MTKTDYVPFSCMMRLYIYAIHGYVIEVIFTAIWDFVVNMNWKFHGVTSIWSMPIYGLSGLILEQMVIKMHKRVPFLVRISIYTAWTLVWEFSTGFILKQFNACPWDYSAFSGEFMGLVTLEYVPAWFIGNVVGERLIIKCMKSLYWGPEHSIPDQFLSPPETERNGYMTYIKQD